MGPEAVAYAYLAFAAAEQIGREEQKRERRNILNASLADADKTQGQAIQQATDEAKLMAPESRQQQMMDAERKMYAQTMGDIQGAGGGQIDTAGGAGAVSGDFSRALVDRQASEGARMSSIASELAKMRAPQDVATTGAMRRGALAERLGSMWSSQRARADAARLDADAVDLPEYAQLAGLMKTGVGAYGQGGGWSSRR